MPGQYVLREKRIKPKKDPNDEEEEPELYLENLQKDII